MKTKDYKNAFAQCQKAIPPGYSLHLISSDNFGSIELLKVLLKRYPVKEITVATWTFNDEFINLLDERVKAGVKTRLIVDRSIKSRRPQYYAYAIEMMQRSSKFKIKLYHLLHCKVVLLSTGTEKLVIEASANFCQNNRIENYVVINSEELFNFHNGWMNELTK